MFLFVNTGCKREELPPFKSPSPPDFILEVHLQKDFTVIIPPGNFFMQGWTNSGGTGNGFIWQWRTIAGPNLPSFEYLFAGLVIIVKVDGIAEGNYDFELTGKDSIGRFAKDTITVNVLKLSSVVSNEILIKNLKWFKDNSLEVEDIFKLVPPGKGFLVYLKREFSTEWVLIPNFFQLSPWVLGYAGYYTLNNEGKLYIAVSSDVNFTDSPTIKIVY